MTPYSDRAISDVKSRLEWDPQFLVFRGHARDMHHAQNHGGLIDLKKQASASLWDLCNSKKISPLEHQIFADELDIAFAETLGKLVQVAK